MSNSGILNGYNVYYDGKRYSTYRYKNHNYRQNHASSYDPYSYDYHHEPYYGHHTSGYGDYHYDHDECCPLVVDPLTLFAFLGFLAGATYFLNTLITMNINNNNNNNPGGGFFRRRTRSTSKRLDDLLWKGEREERISSKDI